MYFLRVFLVLLYALSRTCCDENKDASKSEKQNQASVKQPPCAACRTLVASFVKGMEVTSRGKHEGGDADWEEKKLKNYARSEVRLVEVQEHLCGDVTRGKEQCHSLSEEYEPLMEEWWFSEDPQQASLLAWLCVERLTLCCPENHFGPHCLPCEGGAEKPCSGNGKCKGGGTRKGSGKCDCDKGYAGELCNNCSGGHYEAYKDDKSLICSPCHPACQGTCTRAGPKGCLMCNAGWSMDTERGCEDVNECYSLTQPCTINQFCVNNEGSYSCIDCHDGCNGCDGDGPDMCLECAEGFELQGKLCVDVQQLEDERKLNISDSPDDGKETADMEDGATVMKQINEEL